METPIQFSGGRGEFPTHATNIVVLPGKPRRPSAPIEELDFHASGFVARVEGVWTNADLNQFRHFLDLRQVAVTDEELFGSLERARAGYFQGQNRLLVCGASPCCHACAFDMTDAAIERAGRTAGLPISMTGCQGQCKHAPVMSLRIGDRSQMFAHVATNEDWLAVLAYTKAAVSANSLLASLGSAGPLLHDAVHEHEKPDARLNALRFLLGHFRGEGRFALNGYRFEKEVLGTFEAGGRFIALRMAGSYPLADGRKDTHRAFVMVGPSGASGGIAGRAYTDGGATREYQVEQQEQILLFDDAPPDHGRRWKRSRKVLKPTTEGFEERLEVDAGEGFITYYTIFMRKIDPL